MDADQMKSILDPTFRYVSSGSTDIRKTFDRIRREQRKARELEAAKLTRHVIPMERKA